MASRKVCPPGYHLREGYTRKYGKNLQSTGFAVRRKGKLFVVRPKGNSIRVSSSCVKNKGKKNGSMRIGKLRKGDLIKYGYQYRLSDHLRHEALKKAVKAYGVVSVYRKLDAVSKLSVTSAPDAHTIFVRDREWVHNMFKK